MTFHLHELGFWEPQDSPPYRHSYPDGGNASCYTIEAHSQWFSARNETIEWALDRFPFEGSFIDVGGGNGFQLRYLQERIFRRKKVISAMCEPGAEGCVNAAQRGVTNVYHCDFKSFPVGQYDVGGIGLFDVIEHIENDGSFLLELMESCPAGTRFYITVPAIRLFWSSVDTYARHFRRYDRREYERIANETGLRPVYRTYFFSYYAPFVWFLRVLAGKLRKPLTTEEIVARELGFHRRGKRMLNGILNFLHKVEMFLIRHSVPVPFGTSMLMIFEKK